AGARALRISNQGEAAKLHYEEDESQSPSSSSSNGNGDGDDEAGGVSAYKWCAAVGGIGFLETSYLTYLKLSNTEAICPTGAPSCTTILTSDYSSVLGIPLPLFGMLAYGSVTLLGLNLSSKERRSVGELILIGITTSMAAASTYFLYILSTEFNGESCLYCLASAALSFSSFFLSVKGYGSGEVQKTLGLQLAVASLVIIALSASYADIHSSNSSRDETEVPYFETRISTESSPFAVSLAKHLHSIGAKLYGAFWCSHCLDQKEIFGGEASKLLDYVECFPDGMNKETKMAEACVDAKLKGFPTWSIKGQILEGEKQLSELAALSGFN
ncbi:hypothetical protein M569_02874, partial [Genlisea aurea]